MSSKGVINKKSDAMTVVRDMILGQKNELVKALAGRIDPDAFIRLYFTAMRKDTGILKCKPATILQSLFEAAGLGLAVDGVTGHAWIIPYKGDATLILGYKGMVQIAHRSPKVHAVQARAVYEGDEFEYEFGLEELLRHKPCAADERGKLTYAYAVGRLAGGTDVFVVLPREEVDLIRSRSPGKNSPAWRDDYAAMAMKTAVRNLWRWLPIEEGQTQITREEKLEADFVEEARVPEYEIPTDEPDLDSQSVLDALDVSTEKKQKEPVPDPPQEDLRPASKKQIKDLEAILATLPDDQLKRFIDILSLHSGMREDEATPREMIGMLLDSQAAEMLQDFDGKGYDFKLGDDHSEPAED